jgi:hypothetical protein
MEKRVEKIDYCAACDKRTTHRLKVQELDGQKAAVWVCTEGGEATHVRGFCCPKCGGLEFETEWTRRLLPGRVNRRMRCLNCMEGFDSEQKLGKAVGKPEAKAKHATSEEPARTWDIACERFASEIGRAIRSRGLWLAWAERVGRA